MLKKLSAVGLSCITILVLILSAFTISPSAKAASLEEMTNAAIVCITSHEGSYGSVNPNDCGAVSIGKLQWHATRALNLLKTVCQNDPETAQATIGSDLYNEVLNSYSWETRIFTSSEASSVSALLSSGAGVAAQDALAASDVQQYIISGQNRGMTDAGALVLYADIYNFGGGIASRIASRAAGYAGSYGDVTLNDMYNAAMNDSYGSNSAFVYRTNNVYNYLVSIGYGTSSGTDSTDNTQEPTTESTTEPSSNFSDEYAGTYYVSASSLNLRSGPGTSYSSLTMINKGEEVTVTSGNGEWAAVMYGGYEGYCAMQYLSAVPAETTTEETTTTTEETTTEEITTTVTENTTEEETTTTVAETTTDAEETTDESSETTTVTEESTTAETTATEESTTTTSVLNKNVTLYGDINCDGKVTMEDAVLLQKYLNRSIVLGYVQLANADCVCDSKIDTVDVIVIMEHLVGNYQSLPIL